MANHNPSPATRWPKGVSGNAAGRPPSAGATVNEWRNQLIELTRDELQSVVDDQTASAAKVIAAREILDAMAGNAQAVQRVCDYTSGRPMQTINSNVNPIQRVKRIIMPALSSN